MSTVKQKVVRGLQLDHKWVRIMLSVSTLIVVVIFFMPERKEMASPMIVEYQNPADNLFSRYEVNRNAPIYDTTIVSCDTIVRPVNRTINRTIASVDTGAEINFGVSDTANKSTGAEINFGVSDTANKSTVAEKPLQIQIISEPKSFDWKAFVTWGIGALNGLILVALNIKNLLLKKT